MIAIQKEKEQQEEKEREAAAAAAAKGGKGADKKESVKELKKKGKKNAQKDDNDEVMTPTRDDALSDQSRPLSPDKVIDELALNLKDEPMPAPKRPQNKLERMDHSFANSLFHHSCNLKERRRRDAEEAEVDHDFPFCGSKQLSDITVNKDPVKMSLRTNNDFNMLIEEKH